MSAEEIEWGELPPDRRGGGTKPQWPDRLKPFRERPGQWGKLGRYHTATVTALTNGRYVGIEKGEYEATARNISTQEGKTRCDLWVRYIGGES